MAYINVSAIRQAGGSVSTSGGVTTITTSSGEKIVAPSSSEVITATGGSFSIQETPKYSKEEQGFVTKTTTYSPIVIKEEAPIQQEQPQSQETYLARGPRLEDVKAYREAQEQIQQKDYLKDIKVYAPKANTEMYQATTTKDLYAPIPVRPYEAPDDTILSRFITRQQQSEFDIKKEAVRVSRQQGVVGKIKAGVVLTGSQVFQGAVLDPATLGVAVVTQPKAVGKQVLQDIKTGEILNKPIRGLFEEPVRTVSSFYAYGQIGKAIKGVSKPVIEKVITPKEIGATKGYTVTVTTPTGTSSETISKSIQQIGTKKYTIDTTAKGTTTTTGLSKTSTTTEVSKVIAGQNLPKKTISTTTLGVEKGTKATYLTKGKIGKTPIRQLDIVVSKQKGDYTKFGGAQFDVGKKITDLKLKEYYGGASKKILEKQRLTESGQTFDTTTLTKIGTINVGVKEQPLILKASKPSTQQLRTLKNLETGKTPSTTVTIQKTTSPQVTELINKRTGVEVVKKLYVEEATKNIPIIISTTGTSIKAPITKTTVTEKPISIFKEKTEITVKPIVETKPNFGTIGISF